MSMESLTDYTVRLQSAFSISKTTRYVAFILNQVVMSIESLTDYTVRLQSAFSISTTTKYVASSMNQVVLESLKDFSVKY